MNTLNGPQFFGTDPSVLDANGFPSTTISGANYIAMYLQFNPVQADPSVPQFFEWTPAGAAKLFFITGWQAGYTATGCSVSGGIFNITVTMTAATKCRITFSWNAYPGTNVQVQWQAAAYAPGSPPPMMGRLSDETAIKASIQFGGSGTPFTTEFINAWPNLKTVRVMPYIDNLSVISDWSLRTTLSSLGWITARFPPAIWGGTATGTDQYTIARGSGVSTSAPVDGEVVQANIAIASTQNITISGAANNGSGFVRLSVSSTAALSTSQKVYISNVNNTVEANGVHTITAIGSGTIDIDVTFVNTGGSSGVVGTQTLTITGKSGGAIPIALTTGTAPYVSGGIPATPSDVGGYTFVYSAALKVWICNKLGGITNAPPMEVMIALANSLNANLWFTPPYLTNANYWTQSASMIALMLKPALSAYFEWSNETWNFGFIQYGYSYNAGVVLGMPNGAFQSFTALRYRQMVDAVTTAWTGAGRSTATLRRSLMWQAYGDSSIIGYRLEGSETNPTSNPALCAFLGFTGSCGSAPNYSTVGNRPIDKADVGGYATYFSGANLVNFDGVPPNGSYSTDNAPFLNTIAALYATGVAADLTTALNMIDDDIREGTTNLQSVTVASGTTFTASGTNFSNNDIVVGKTTGAFFTGLSLHRPYFVVNVSGATFKLAATYGGTALTGISGGTGTQSIGKLGGNVQQTLLNLSSFIYRNPYGVTQYPGWESVMAGYDAARAGFTPAEPPLRGELYEGGNETIPPTAATCALIGVSSPPLGGGASTAANAATNIAALWEIYKNRTSPINYGSALSLSQFQQFMGTDASSATFGLMAHSRTPSWFLLLGPSQWSLMQGGTGSTPYQIFNGVQSFIGIQNFLLKRDIDPASNDNDPMWLEKAA